MEFPLELRVKIEEAAASAAPGELQRAAEAMSEAYRTRTGRGARMVQTEVAVLAYAAARMPATFGAAAQAMQWTRAALEEAPESLLDVGAGTGAAAWAAREVFPEVREYAMWEREPAMIALGERLMRGEAAFAGAQWVQGVLGTALGEPIVYTVDASWVLGVGFILALLAAALPQAGETVPLGRRTKAGAWGIVLCVIALSFVTALNWTRCSVRRTRIQSQPAFLAYRWQNAVFWRRWCWRCLSAGTAIPPP